MSLKNVLRCRFGTASAGAATFGYGSFRHGLSCTTCPETTRSLGTLPGGLSSNFGVRREVLRFTRGFRAALTNARSPTCGLASLGRPESPRRCTLEMTAFRVMPPSSPAIWLAVAPSPHNRMRRSVLGAVHEGSNAGEAAVIDIAGPLVGAQQHAATPAPTNSHALQNASAPPPTCAYPWPLFLACPSMGVGHRSYSGPPRHR